MEQIEVADFSPLNSMVLAFYIAKFCKENNIDLNVTKLQKLMYCSYGTVLGKFGQRLTEEHPHAGKYGPVFRESLRSMKFFGVAPFAEKDSETVNSLPHPVKKLIGDSIKYFGRYSAPELSSWSHQKGSPWAKATNNGAFLFVEIDDKDISRYFRDKVLA